MASSKEYLLGNLHGKYTIYCTILNPKILMLIDFEKDFDSISWKCVYKTLEVLGFGKKFLNWVNIFNNKISASVLQVSIKSEPLCIERGCKQGDPIAPYLYYM